MKFPTPNGEIELSTRSDAETATEPEPERNMDNLTQRELREAIRDYAESYTLAGVQDQPDLDSIPFDISRRLKSTAGKVQHKRGTGEIVRVRFAWKAYQRWGWERFTSTIRHELIHVWELQEFGKAGHGPVFKRVARQNDTTVNCEHFAQDEAKFELLCSECGGNVAYRHKRSKTVTNPENYRSKCCKAPLEVRDLRH